MDALFDICVGKGKDLRTQLPYIYKKCSKDSHLRKFSVDLVALTWKNLGAYVAKVPQEPHPPHYLEDVIEQHSKQKKWLKKEDFAKSNKCRYHDHKEPHQEVEPPAAAAKKVSSNRVPEKKRKS